MNFHPGQFHPGQRVRCVNPAGWARADAPGTEPIGPTKGAIYRIETVRMAPCPICGETAQWLFFAEFGTFNGYAAAAFRPIEDEQIEALRASIADLPAARELEEAAP